MASFEESPKKKGTCPQCGKKGCWTFMRDENNNRLPEEYGICDHKNSCNYHNVPNGTPQNLRPVKEENPLPVIYPTTDHLMSLLNHPHPSAFHRFCKNLGLTSAFLALWGVGTDIDGKTAFIHVAQAKTETQAAKPVNVKFMAYSEDGHRIRNTDGKPDVSFLIAPKEQNPETGEVVAVARYEMCFYGQHRLPSDKNEKIVCIVESEKTAVLCAFFYPEFAWLSSGGSQGISKKVAVLHNRHILLLPDADQAGREGYEKALKTLIGYGINAQFIDIFPDRSDSYDLADALAEGNKPAILWEYKFPKELVPPQKKRTETFVFENYNFDKHKKVEVPNIYTFDAHNKPRDFEPLLQFRENGGNYQNLGRAGDIVAFLAMPKRGKSSLAEAVLASVINPDNASIDTFGLVARLQDGKKILHIDTEMTDADVWLSMERTFRRASKQMGNHPLIDCYGLTGVETIEETILFCWNKMYSGDYGIVIADGITDLLDDPNNLSESKALVKKIRAVASKMGFLFITTIHTGENSQKARGHIGSEIERKCSWACHIEKQKSVYVASTKQGRKIDPEVTAFAFAWDNEQKMFASCEIPEPEAPGKVKSKSKETAPGTPVFKNPNPEKEDSRVLHQEPVPENGEDLVLDLTLSIPVLKELIPF